MYRYIHGSEDSQDVDVCYVFDNMPNWEECRRFCSADKSENRNIIYIENGEVVKCFKGVPDEVNNSVFTTYSLHEQEYPLRITHMVKRNIPSKCDRAMIKVLAMFTRTTWRPEVKAALRGEWDVKMEMLRRLGTAECEIFRDLDEEKRKSVAFQIGQTIGLFEGYELYTKKAIVDNYPELRPFLYREKGEEEVLQKYMRIFAEYIKKKEELS